MGILVPSEAVARRWAGALQARQRRAPLEAFLRTRAVLPASAGVAQDSDNLARATVLIVEAGLALYFRDREDGLAPHRRMVVGHVACLVSSALAQEYSQLEAWRIGALVSSAQLLSPWIGLNPAAVVSAAIARQFPKEIVSGISPLDWSIMRSACDAVTANDAAALAKASIHISARLTAEAPQDRVQAPGCLRI